MYSNNSHTNSNQVKQHVNKLLDRFFCCYRLVCHHSCSPRQPKNHFFLHFESMTEKREKEIKPHDNYFSLKYLEVAKFSFVFLRFLGNQLNKTLKFGKKEVS